jgi:hypothetical protein
MELTVLIKAPQQYPVIAVIDTNQATDFVDELGIIEDCPYPLGDGDAGFDDERNGGRRWVTMMLDFGLWMVDY